MQKKKPPCGGSGNLGLGEAYGCILLPLPRGVVTGRFPPAVFVGFEIPLLRKVRRQLLLALQGC
jgi:hypothetical protein